MTNETTFKLRPAVSHIAMAVLALSALASAPAFASGYQFGSQTVSGQGNADAGSAEADDASTVFYNPAGMSRLKNSEFTLGATIAIPYSTYTDYGSTQFTGAPTGGTGASDYVPSSVTAPSIYFTTPIDKQWTFGVGLFVPYGSQLDYGNTWTGRYALTNIKLQSIDINPSVSFKLDEKNSFGFGISAQYMKASLGQAVDVPGSVQVLSGTPAAAALAQQIAQLGGNPAALANVHDAQGSMNGDHWGFGFNLGYMFQLSDSTRFGLAYRSSVSQNLKGNATWDFSGVTSDQITNAVLASASHRENSAADLSVRTPETLSANVYSQLDSRWAVMGDITWTRNSRLNNIDIRFPGTVEGDDVIRQDWKNTTRVSVGANYRVNDALLLRSGIAFDQSPVVSPQLTDPGFPDSNRVWYSLGMNYRFDKHSSIDAAYSYVAFKDVLTDYTNSCNPLNASCTGNGETTYGKYSTNIQFVGIAYNYTF